MLETVWSFLSFITFEFEVKVLQRIWFEFLEVFPQSHREIALPTASSALGFLNQLEGVNEWLTSPLSLPMPSSQNVAYPPLHPNNEPQESNLLLWFFYILNYCHDHFWRRTLYHRFRNYVCLDLDRSHWWQWGWISFNYYRRRWIGFFRWTTRTQTGCIRFAKFPVWIFIMVLFLPIHVKYRLSDSDVLFKRRSLKRHQVNTLLEESIQNFYIESGNMIKLLISTVI